MQCDKYNNYVLWNILRSFKYNPYYTVGKLEEYIIDYPNDFLGYSYFAQVLIDVGDFDKAKSVFQLIDYVFSNKIDARVKYNKLRLLTFTGDYESAESLYNDNKDELKNFDSKIEMIETFYKVNKGQKLERSPLSYMYLYNQIVDYGEKDFLSHMTKHLADYNKDLDTPNPVIFNPDFPIEKVVEELKKIVPNEKRTYIGLFTNFYVFKYENVGKISNKSVDYFRVVTIHNTNNFITMYPMQHGEMLPYIDLNYLNDNYDKPKVKQLSMVDKFYDRYGK